LQVVTSRAGAVAHAACYSDTLSAWRAVCLCLTASQDTALAYLAVRRLTATVPRTSTGGALHKGIAIVARWTLAVVAAGQIFAESIQTTDWLISCGEATLVHISTKIALSLKASLAHTLSLGAEFTPGTRLCVRALDLACLTKTGHIRIPREAGGAFATVAALGVLAEGICAAGGAQALVDVDAAWLAEPSGLVALVAHAPGHTVHHCALGVRRTEHVRTGACTQE